MQPLESPLSGKFEPGLDCRLRAGFDTHIQRSMANIATSGRLNLESVVYIAPEQLASIASERLTDLHANTQA